MGRVPPLPPISCSPRQEGIYLVPLDLLNRHTLQLCDSRNAGSGVDAFRAPRKKTHACSDHRVHEQDVLISVPRHDESQISVRGLARMDMTPMLLLSRSLCSLYNRRIGQLNAIARRDTVDIRRHTVTGETAKTATLTTDSCEPFCEFENALEIGMAGTSLGFTIRFREPGAVVCRAKPPVLVATPQ